MSFNEIKKNFGFGCMRLPMAGEEVDTVEFNKMIDYFIENGFNYFDTAHGYINGKSETAIRECLTSHYPRESYLLANKLTSPYFETEADIRPFFENQLKWCGVDYFDFYLFHALNRSSYEKHKACNSFGIVKQLKEEGKVRHIAMSFHDSPEVLDMILTENPFIEAVQLQINYLDKDDPSVQSEACYKVARKHGKPIIVMEPVKGGALVNLPNDANELLKGITNHSNAAFAIRYAASLEGVFMVLSGMGNMDMMKDNVSSMKEFTPFTSEEFEASDKVREIIRRVKQIGCTKCEYCLEGCPMDIKIPAIFAAYNEYLGAKKTRRQAKELLPTQGGTASDCIKCGACEDICPQKLPIRKLLEKAANDFR